MTTKQFSIFMAALVFLFALAGGGQSGTTILIPAQTNITGCAWNTAAVTVTNGLAICPLNLTTGPALAIAVNGGALSQIPMTAGTAGVRSFNGRTGAVTLLDADVTGTGLKIATSVTTTSTSTAVSTPQ
jgi:hypothetical protein